MCRLHNIWGFILIREQLNQYLAIIKNAKCSTLLFEQSLKINREKKWLQPCKDFTVLLICFLAPYCSRYKTLVWFVSFYLFVFFGEQSQMKGTYAGNNNGSADVPAEAGYWKKKLRSTIHNAVPEITFLSQIESRLSVVGPETLCIEAMRWLACWISFSVLFFKSN